MPVPSYVLIVTIVAVSSVGHRAVAHSPEDNGDYIRFNLPHIKVTGPLEEIGTP